MGHTQGYETIQIWITSRRRNQFNIKKIKSIWIHLDVFEPYLFQIKDINTSKKRGVIHLFDSKHVSFNCLHCNCYILVVLCYERRFMSKLARSKNQVSFSSNLQQLLKSNCEQFPDPVQSADLVSARFIVTLLIKSTKGLYVQKMNLIMVPYKLPQCLQWRLLVDKM